MTLLRNLEKLPNMIKIKNFFNLRNSNNVIKFTDRIFVIIFLVLLVIPVFKINMSDKSMDENRYLAKFPLLYNEERKFNSRIGSDFNDWLSDRFFLRYELIKLNRLYSCVPNINYCLWNKDVFDKKNNVLGTYRFFGLTDFDKKKKYDIKKPAENIQKLNDWCKQNNIKLYILIVPRQSDFIIYNIPNRLYKTSEDIGEKIVKYAKEHTDANIIYPYEEMKEANKTTPVFFKTDHHWTQTGAYVGYKALVQEIKKDFPDINIVDISEYNKSTNKMVKIYYKSPFNYGSMLRNSGLPNWYQKRIMDTNYIYYSTPKFDNLNILNKSDLPDFNENFDCIYKYDKGANKKVLLIGNSYTGNLMEFLPFSFKEVLSLSDNYRKLYFNKYEKLVQSYKPDIMIINIHTVNMVIFNNLYKKVKGEE